MFNFDKTKPPKCVHCGKERGLHKAVTLHCPAGMKTRIGYTSFGLTTFKPKVTKA